MALNADQVDDGSKVCLELAREQDCSQEFDLGGGGIRYSHCNFKTHVMSHT